MKNALLRYRELFRSMIEQNNPAPISNESRLHAAIIIQELVRSAKESVYIQCSRLAPDVYGNPETLKEIKDALARNVKFRVAVRSNFPQTTELYEILTLAPNADIQLGREVYSWDYCVVDGRRVRFETDAVLGRAVAVAFDEELGSLLTQTFNRGYSAA